MVPTSTTDSQRAPKRAVLIFMANPITKEANTAPAQLPKPPMIHTARAVGLKIMIGCMIESSIAITAAAHITPLVDAADLDGNLLLGHDPYQGVTVEEGTLVIPGGPGLGVCKR